MVASVLEELVADVELEAGAVSGGNAEPMTGFQKRVERLSGAAHPERAALKGSSMYAHHFRDTQDSRRGLVRLPLARVTARSCHGNQPGCQTVEGGYRAARAASTQARGQGTEIDRHRSFQMRDEGSDPRCLAERSLANRSDTLARHVERLGCDEDAES